MDLYVQKENTGMKTEEHFHIRLYINISGWNHNKLVSDRELSILSAREQAILVFMI